MILFANLIFVLTIVFGVFGLHLEAAPSFHQFWSSLSSQKEDELLKLLESRNWFERAGALLAFETKDTQKCLHWARKLINDPALLVRLHAARILLKSHDSQDVKLLVDELYHPRNFLKGRSLFIRQEIAKGLLFTPENKNKLSERLIAKLSTDSDPMIRRWVSQGVIDGTK
ncbi:MAG: HEAT repeat domain-containing protein [Bdellovibrionaceae bacterium]|nr:HEAT repeat domain-containing protein [Pseudobdellovibrionaceae bacterium]MDW8190458.1 HEAT repeat domain-containing protein [Pseudobdellovibrionaceae bacterium]